MFISVMARLIASQARLRRPMVRLIGSAVGSCNCRSQTLAHQIALALGMPRITTAAQRAQGPVAVDLIVPLRLSCDQGLDRRAVDREIRMGRRRGTKRAGLLVKR